MFTADDIKARIRERPFKPVRIVTSAGQAFDLYHPDLIMIGRRELMIGKSSAENPTEYEQATRVAILHVTALEDLPASSLPNGQSQQ